MDFRALAREEVKRLLLEAGKPYRDGRGRDERHRALEAWVSRRAHELCAEWLAREGPPPAAARAPRTPAALLAFLESQPPPAKKAVCFVCHAADHESDSCLAGTQRPRERGASADSHASSKRRTYSSGSAGSVAAALRAAALSGDDSGSADAAAGAGGADIPAEAAREDASAMAVARASRSRRAYSGGAGASSGGGLPADLRRLEHVAASLTAAVAALSAPPALAAAAAASQAAAAHGTPVHVPAGNPFAAAAHPHYATLLSPEAFSVPSAAHADVGMHAATGGHDDFSAQLGFHFDS